MIKGIAFTGIPVTDIARAREYYEDVLGLKLSAEMAHGKWIEYDVGGATVALTSINPRWEPSDQGTAVGFEVDDIDAMLDAIKESGAPVYMDKMESPVCWLAIVQDPDGNKVVIHKLKPG